METEELWIVYKCKLYVSAPADPLPYLLSFGNLVDYGARFDGHQMAYDRLLSLLKTWLPLGKEQVDDGALPRS